MHQYEPGRMLAPAQHHMPPRPSAPPPLPTPDLSACDDIRPAHCSVTVVDGNGRIAVTSPLRALRWPPGTLLAFNHEADSVIAVTQVEGPVSVEDTAPRREVTSRGFVNLPVITRRRAGIVNGDRLLIVVNAKPGVLLILAPTAVARMLRYYTSGQDPQP